MVFRGPQRRDGSDSVSLVPTQGFDRDPLACTDLDGIVKHHVTLLRRVFVLRGPHVWSVERHCFDLISKVRVIFEIAENGNDEEEEHVVLWADRRPERDRIAQSALLENTRPVPNGGHLTCNRGAGRK